MIKKYFFLILIFVASALSQSVVVNKYFNSGAANGVGDVVELLVIQNNLDMRGMLIKDFSSSMGGDGGGKFQFTQNSLWQSVKSGTLIILRNDSSNAHVNPAEYVFDLGLKNSVYFIPKGGSFDIATTEMVMIKTAGSDSAGVTGSIHCLAGGTAGSNFTAAPEPKLRSTTTSGTNKFIIAKNSNSVLADYNGTDATTDSTAIFGQGNTTTNTTFINTLRGGAPQTTTVQFTSGGMSVERTVGTVQVLVSISNPSNSNPTSVSVALTGGTGVNGVDIQNFTTQNLTFPAASSSNQTFNVVVNNIQTPNQATFIFTLQNVSGGNSAILGSPTNFTLTLLSNIADTSQVMPIATYRTNDASGVPVEANKYVTIAGVITIANEINSPSYMQDSTAGIAVYGRGVGQFSSKYKIGDLVKVKGRLTHFRGLTQLDSVQSSELLDSNKVVEPKILTIPQILNQNWNGFEAYEGSLVKIMNVQTDSVGLWLGNLNYVIYNGTDQIQMRVTNGTNLVGQNIPLGTFNVVAALGQYKSAAPYSDGYQLLPRFYTDITPATSVKENNILNSFKLSQNYPNPFNPSTTIEYEIPQVEGNNFITSLRIYDILGRNIETLVNEHQNSGKYSITWNAKNYPSGVYYFELKCGDYREIKNMILLK